MIYLILVIIPIAFIYLLYKLSLLRNKYRDYEKLDQIIALLIKDNLTNYNNRSREDIIESFIYYMSNDNLCNRYLKYGTTEAMCSVNELLKIKSTVISEGKLLVIDILDRDSELQSGDIIVEINHQNPMHFTFTNIPKFLDLNLLRIEDYCYKEKNLVASNILSNKLENSYHVNGDSITIKLSFFNKVITDHIFQSVITENIRNLILDLRNNYGGDIELMGDFLEYLYPKGTILYHTTNNKDSNCYVEQSAKTDSYFTFDNIEILVSKNTASSAEIMSQSLKENLGAIIIGERTYGKGIIQLNYHFSDQTKLTLPKWEVYGPNKTKIDQTGVSIDTYLENDEINYLLERRKINA